MSPTEHADMGGHEPVLYAKKIRFDDDGNPVEVLEDYGLVAGPEEIEMSDGFKERMVERFGEEEAARIYARTAHGPTRTPLADFMRQGAQKKEEA